MRTLIYKVNKSQTTEFILPLTAGIQMVQIKLHCWGAGRVTYKASYWLQPKTALKIFTKNANLTLVAEKITRKTSNLVCYMENYCAEK